MFQSLGISCKVDVHHTTPNGPQAWESLLKSVQHYFSTSTNYSQPLNSNPKVFQTQLPPIYLQRPRHSLTIIGYETRTDGSSNLLVFDPAFMPFMPSRHIRQAALCAETGTSFDLKHPRARLRPYRRGKSRLRWYHCFETLMLATPIPLPSDVKQ
jgi:zinc finger-containing ubiquitin peptidase 1